MLVHGAIVPPRIVLDAVTAVVRTIPGPVEVAPASAAKGIFGRLGRRDAAQEPTVAAPPVLDHIPIDRLHLPITGFGNLTTSDAHRLADVLAAAAAGWTAPTVHFAGGAALEFPGDPCVWAKLEGDVDELMAVARGVTQSVEQLGFFVDRRAFRPMLALATVTTSTTGPYLQEVVDALDAFRGQDWTVADIVLTKDTFETGRPEEAEFRRIPLAPA